MIEILIKYFIFHLTIHTDICDSAHCNNRGVCIQIAPTQQRICNCHENYMGSVCQLANPCQIKKPCMHGTCYPVLNATVKATSLESADYTCQCFLGYAGKNCDQNSGYDPCSSNPCHLNGVCVVLENNKGYKCKYSRLSFKSLSFSIFLKIRLNPKQNKNKNTNQKVNGRLFYFFLLHIIDDNL